MCRLSVIVVTALLDVFVFSSFLFSFLRPFAIEQAIALSIPPSPPEIQFIGRFQEWDVSKLGGRNECRISNYMFIPCLSG